MHEWELVWTIVHALWGVERPNAMKWLTSWAIHASVFSRLPAAAKYQATCSAMAWMLIGDHGVNCLRAGLPDLDETSLVAWPSAIDMVLHYFSVSSSLVSCYSIFKPIKCKQAFQLSCSSGSCYRMTLPWEIIYANVYQASMHASPTTVLPPSILTSFKLTL